MADSHEEAPPVQQDPISPSTFVEHIRELGQKRDKEDAERYRLLEEQILQGRAERAARRAERHRSLSPAKSSAAGSPAPIDTPTASHEKPLASPITMDASHQDALSRLTGSSSPADSPPKPASPAPNTPNRSGTLSWQQRRPTSSSGRRPLSAYAAENIVARSPRLGATPDPPADENDNPSRSQIAQSLGSKDPAWFRQTADRGIGSPANRRSHEDAASEVDSAFGRRQLPGMRDSTATTEGASSPPTESVRSDSPSRGSSVRNSARLSTRFSRDTSVSGFSNPDTKTLLPTLESQKFRPPGSEISSSTDDNEGTGSPRPLAMSPAQGRVAADRSPSPTKGMGGFVQSAMMKRSDSVNKRWSAHGTPVLTRNTSTTSSASGLGIMGSSSMPKLEAIPSGHGEYPSRPSSSNSNRTVIQNTVEKHEAPVSEGFPRPTLSMRHSRGKSLGSFAYPGTDDTNSPDASSPTKRWSRSPTKSSWLESALLAKPESPRPRPPPPQPSWMAEISKVKAQRQSVDLSKIPDLPKPSSPAAPLSPAARFRGKSISRGSAGSPVAQSPDADPSPTEKITEPEQLQAPEAGETTATSPNTNTARLPSPTAATMEDPVPSPTLNSPADKSEKPAVALKSPGLRQTGGPKSPTVSAKPETAPKLDFRSQLRSRQSPAPAAELPKKDAPVEDFRTHLKTRQARAPTTSTTPAESPKTSSPADQSLEFQNVFGKLKRTQTDKFVAPDTLKDNILRGKDGLTKTDGPQKNERRDELRDSLVKQRQSIQMKAQETGVHSRTGSRASPEEAAPEALSKRLNLGRTGSVSTPPSSSPSKESPIPEALALSRSLRERKQSVANAKLSPSEEKPEETDEKPAVDAGEEVEKKNEDPKEEHPNEESLKVKTPVESPKEETPKQEEPQVEALKNEDVKEETLKEKVSEESPKDESPKEKELPKDEAKKEEAPKAEPPKVQARVAGLSEKLANRFPPAAKPSELKHGAKPSWSKEPGTPAEEPKRTPGKLADRFPALKSPTPPIEEPKKSPVTTGKLADRFPALKSPTPPVEETKRTPSPSNKLADRFPALKSPTPPAEEQNRAPSPSNKLADRFPARKEPPAPVEEPKRVPSPPNKLADRFPGLKSTEPKEPEAPVGKLGGRSSGPGKLADRFNPALAGILARGPPVANGAPGSRESGGSGASGSTASPEEPKGPAKELTHITKGRARGPKRRAPKGKTDSGIATPEETPVKTEPTHVRKASVPVPTVPLVKPKDVLPSSRPTSLSKDELPSSRPTSLSKDNLPSSRPTSLSSKPKDDLPSSRPTSLSKDNLSSSRPTSLNKTVVASEPAASEPATTEPAAVPDSAAESPKLEQKQKPAVAAKSAEVTRRVSAKLDSPATTTEPPVPAKSPELTRRISEKFESRAASPSSVPAESPQVSKRSSEISKRASDISKRDSTDSSKRTSGISKSGSDSSKRASDRLSTPTTPTEPPVPAKSPDLIRRISGKLDSTPAEPSPPAKSPDLAKRFSGEKKEAEQKEEEQKKDAEQTPPVPSAAPKPLFAERMRQFQQNQQQSSPKTPVESPKPLKPLPKPSAAIEEKDLPAKPNDEPPSVKNAAASWGRQSTESTASTKVKSPIKLPTRKDEQEAIENAGLMRSETPKGPVGLGIGLEDASNRLQSKVEEQQEQSVPEIAEPTPPTKSRPISKPLPSPPLSAGLPPKPPKKPDSMSPPLPQIKQDSPIPHTSEASRMFGDFFDELPVTTSQLDIDTNAILTAQPLSHEKIKTVRKQVEEITGDGKLSPVPSQEEHILYDSSMYLCTHVFGSSNGAKSTEVYLWAGSAVPEPTVDDAQLFARKAARDAGGKLIIIRQGKETPNFLHGIGGILITRKGTRQEHSNEYMLCGRQHLGNIVFDEVELVLSNLCSGFPYLVSSRTGLLSGKIFLWKGHGCNAEELGCARLIGMDLGLTPEIEEVDEGKEPDAFMDIFPAPENGIKRIPRSADHWRLKAKYEKYGARLFRIDEKPAATMSSSFMQSNNNALAVPDSPERDKPKMKADVTEVAPFAQADLEAESIYVLDAFFEVYVIVGALSRSQAHAFSTALLFAQEYGILAASLEDRPFVPVSTVVLEGVPRDMKAVFRRWEDGLQPTAALMAGKPRNGKSLRIVGLQAAIAATRA